MVNRVAPRLGLPRLHIHACGRAIRTECILECPGRRKPPKFIPYTSRSGADSDLCTLTTHVIGWRHNPKHGLSQTGIWKRFSFDFAGST